MSQASNPSTPLSLLRRLSARLRAPMAGGATLPDPTVPDIAPFDKRQNMLGGLALDQARGLEFGPLMSPMVRKSEGQIAYIDHVDTEGLRSKYAKDANVDTRTIVDIDFVDDGRPLREIVGAQSFDYVVASHVFEHVPNPIHWLNQCASILSPHGRLALAIPDKRYTFDFFRPLTTVSEWVEALVEERRRPSVRSVHEAALMTPGIDFSDLWNRKPVLPPLDHKQLGWTLQMARDARRDYVDVHCTVCTPESLCRLMGEAALLDQHPFGLERLYPTVHDQIEFQMRLQLRSDLSAVERAATFAEAGAKPLA